VRHLQVAVLVPVGGEFEAARPAVLVGNAQGASCCAQDCAAVEVPAVFRRGGAEEVLHREHGRVEAGGDRGDLLAQFFRPDHPVRGILVGSRVQLDVAVRVERVVAASASVEEVLGAGG
jgi:hypothetical protein